MPETTLTAVGATTATLDIQTLRQVFADPQPVEIAGVPHVVLPAGMTLVDVTKPDRDPIRISRTVHANDVRGFCAYLALYAGEETLIYCGPPTHANLLALIDDHTPGEPSQVTHRVTYNCPLTLEWSTWLSRDKRPLKQVEFAEFIEANIRDVVSPAAADLLAAALNFQDTTTAEFSSAVRLENGHVQFAFTQRDAGGRVAFPGSLTIGIPVFEGLPVRFPLTAKLRYRVKDQSLTLWYELERPDLVLRQAYDELLQHVEDETGRAPIRALPAA